jgi:hypothetical protein
MTDPTLIFHLIALYRAASETSAYQGETVEDVLERMWPDNPAAQSPYRDSVIDDSRARTRKDDHSCRWCDASFSSNRARVGHETQAHPVEWRDSLDRDQMLDDYDAGHKLDTIARIHGVSNATVSATVRAAGRTSRRGKRRKTA